jgi:MFS family permease
MIPLLIFCWSCVLIGTGFMHNVGQLYASRLLLGLFESGMFPCLALYLSTFYSPGEQALRISYLFVSAALSGSFGGLFAYALLKMDGVGGLEGWRWLFIIEGCASVLVAAFTYMMLPDDFEHARFLNEDEKSMMRVRAEINARYNGKPDFDWEEVMRAVRDPKLYISCWSQFMADICSFGLSSFLPLIIRSFGYGVVTTQLLTIPVFFWASAAYIVVSYLSDRWKQRALFMMPAALVTAVGYAVNIGVPMDQRGVLYFSTFLIAPGVYMIVGLNCAWLLNSHAPYYKRAMAIGMNQSIGNTAGIVVSPPRASFQNRQAHNSRLAKSSARSRMENTSWVSAVLLLPPCWQSLAMSHSTSTLDARTNGARILRRSNGRPRLPLARVAISTLIIAMRCRLDIPASVASINIFLAEISTYEGFPTVLPRSFSYPIPITSSKCPLDH